MKQHEKRKYLITQQQIENIDHYKRMYELNATRIQQLCSEERSDIEYGFELGEIHSHLRQCFIDMMELEGEIRSQEVTKKDK